VFSVYTHRFFYLYTTTIQNTKTAKRNTTTQYIEEKRTNNAICPK